MSESEHAIDCCKARLGNKSSAPVESLCQQIFCRLYSYTGFYSLGVSQGASRNYSIGDWARGSRGRKSLGGAPGPQG